MKDLLERYLLTLIAIGLVFQSCSSDNLDGNQEPSIQIASNRDKVKISEELQPFIDKFVDEMNQRGLNLQTYTLTAELVDHFSYPQSPRPCGIGYTNFENSGNPRIEILNNRACWDRWDETEKENLVFHELGHALLSKVHNNNVMPNGSNRSLMCGRGTCNNYRVYNTYQVDQRAYYLDQLADKTIDIPEWASEKTISRTLVDNDFDNGITDWSSNIELHANFTEELNSEVHYDFQIAEESLFSAPNGLAISTISNSETASFAFWEKSLSISEFENCSNVVIRSDIATKDLQNIHTGMAVRLLRVNSEGEFEIFSRYSNAIEENGLGDIILENFEIEIICLPPETDAISILLFLYDGRTNNFESVTATFDNLVIELHE